MGPLPPKKRKRVEKTQAPKRLGPSGEDGGGPFVSKKKTRGENPGQRTKTPKRLGPSGEDGWGPFVNKRKDAWTAWSKRGRRMGPLPPKKRKRVEKTQAPKRLGPSGEDGWGPFVSKKKKTRGENSGQRTKTPKRLGPSGEDGWGPFVNKRKDAWTAWSKRGRRMGPLPPPKKKQHVEQTRPENCWLKYKGMVRSCEKSFLLWLQGSDLRSATGRTYQKIRTVLIINNYMR